ncbi:MAG: hypothetical protein M3445_08260 [Actinomycetota bacterium]|nr:hypothetical protein [Actinomycetota bacterium]
MNHQQAVMICAIVQQAIPHKTLDEFTADIWAELLVDVDFDDARAATMSILSTNAYVAPSDIRAEVRRIRARRLDTYGRFPDPPPEITTHDQWRSWHIACRDHIASGRPIPADMTVAAGDREPPVLDGVFSKVPTR